ncbi:hypothetical protein ACV3J7_07215 [Salmonella enterica]
MSRKTARRAEKSAELALMEEMNERLKGIETNLEEVKHTAAKSGAIAGTITGGVAGGLVATGLMIIKATIGMG